MGDTKIQWSDKTWNISVGCTKVSPGCKNCYAKELHDKRHRAYQKDHKSVPKQYALPFETVQLIPLRLPEPLSWRKPQRVFVNNVSDLFHEDIPLEYLDMVFGVMALAKHHTFQVLTKRPERMADYLNGLRKASEGRFFTPAFFEHVSTRFRDEGATSLRGKFLLAANEHVGKDLFPFPNIWLGTSVEDQKAADSRIPHLVRTPAAVRFLSCEPLLGSVNLKRWLWEFDPDASSELGAAVETPSGKLGWLIVGGESGNGARPLNLAHARDLVAQCKAAHVPTFVKQLGATFTEDKERPLTDEEILQDFGPLAEFAHGGGTSLTQLNYRPRDRKGGDMAEWPSDLRIREFPKPVKVGR